MAARTVRSIHLFPRVPSFAQLLFRQAIVWTFLVGSIGLSRVWFGGAFVIDFLALVFALCAFVALGSRAVGQAVFMTPAELRDYVNAGCPADAKAWAESYRIYGSGAQ